MCSTVRTWRSQPLRGASPRNGRMPTPRGGAFPTRVSTHPKPLSTRPSLPVSRARASEHYRGAHGYAQRKGHSLKGGPSEYIYTIHNDGLGRIPRQTKKRKMDAMTQNVGEYVATVNGDTPKPVTIAPNRKGRATLILSCLSALGTAGMAAYLVLNAPIAGP